MIDTLAIALSYVLAVILGIGLRVVYPLSHKTRMKMREVMLGFAAGIALVGLGAVVLFAPF